MEHRWFKVVVVLFWMGTMTWLVVEKVLPPLYRGEPPSIQSVYGGMEPDSPPVCWTVSWDNKPIGWAPDPGRSASVRDV